MTMTTMTASFGSSSRGGGYKSCSMSEDGNDASLTFTKKILWRMQDEYDDEYDDSNVTFSDFDIVVKVKKTVVTAAAATDEASGDSSSSSSSPSSGPSPPKTELLQVRERRYRVHRNILVYVGAHPSEYFAGCFRTQHQQQQQSGSMDFVVVDGEEVADAFPSFLDYAYVGRLELDELAPSAVVALLHLGSYCGVPELVAEVQRYVFVEGKLCADTLAEYLPYIVKYQRDQGMEPILRLAKHLTVDAIFNGGGGGDASSSECDNEDTANDNDHNNCKSQRQLQQISLRLGDLVESMDVQFVLDVLKLCRRLVASSNAGERSSRLTTNGNDDGNDEGDRQQENENKDRSELIWKLIAKFITVHKYQLTRDDLDLLTSVESTPCAKMPPEVALQLLEVESDIIGHCMPESECNEGGDKRHSITPLQKRCMDALLSTSDEGRRSSATATIFKILEAANAAPADQTDSMSADGTTAVVTDELSMITAAEKVFKMLEEKQLLARLLAHGIQEQRRKYSASCSFSPPPPLKANGFRVISTASDLSDGWFWMVHPSGSIFPKTCWRFSKNGRWQGKDVTYTVILLEESGEWVFGFRHRTQLRVPVEQTVKVLAVDREDSSMRWLYINSRDTSSRVRSFDKPPTWGWRPYVKGSCEALLDDDADGDSLEEQPLIPHTLPPIFLQFHAEDDDEASV